MKQPKLQEKDIGIMFFEHKTITRPSPFPWEVICYGFQKPNKNKLENLIKVVLLHIEFNTTYQTTLLCWSLWTSLTPLLSLSMSTN
jgi:hypothetical protein